MASWTRFTLETDDDLEVMLQTALEEDISVGSFDTETNGLFITKSKPFLFQFGHAVIERHMLSRGWTYAVDIERDKAYAKKVFLAWMEHVAPKLKLLTGSNMLFDLHMLANWGATLSVEKLLGMESLTDLQCLARCALPSRPVTQKGPPLGLEKLAAYLKIEHADDCKKDVTLERSKILLRCNKRLTDRLSAEGKIIVSETGFDKSLLGQKDRHEYELWLASLPDEIRENAVISTGKLKNDPHTGEGVPYNFVDRGKLIRYGHQDIELAIRCAMILYGSAMRTNAETVELERKVAPVTYRMDRQPLCIDRRKLEEAYERTRLELAGAEAELEELTGLKPTQTQKMLDWAKSIDPAFPNTTDQKTLKPIMKSLDPAITEMLELLWRFRNLNKIFKKDLCGLRRWNGEWHPQTNSHNACTGRFSSPAQQFPREPAMAQDGSKLFHAREIFIPKKGFCSFFFDYSQLESRLQLLNVIRVGSPSDEYMRSYMPYKLTGEDGRTYDELSERDKASITLGEKWTYPDGSEWKPLDLHSETAKVAYSLDGSEPDFKKYRSSAKNCSFAISYGAGVSRLMSMFPEKEPDEIREIFNAFYDARGGFRDYVNYCKRMGASARPVIECIGHRAYIEADGHSLVNYLTQGAAASLLKIKLIELDEYLREHGLADRLYLTVHDEAQLYLTEDEAKEHVPDIVHVLEKFEGCPVPILCDVEWTRTNWAEKEPYEFTRKGGHEHI